MPATDLPPYGTPGWKRRGRDEHGMGARASDELEPYRYRLAQRELPGRRGPERRSAYEPAAFARLQDGKRRYDPTNFFRLNQNIAPE
jgi:hypothetical protein